MLIEEVQREREWSSCATAARRIGQENRSRCLIAAEDRQVSAVHSRIDAWPLFTPSRLSARGNTRPLRRAEVTRALEEATAREEDRLAAKMGSNVPRVEVKARTVVVGTSHHNSSLR